MDNNRIAMLINASSGYSSIRLGFWLNKQPNKTAEEDIAAKAFLKVFWGAFCLTMLSIVILFFFTWYVLDRSSIEYQGGYSDSRVGRVENGQIRYIKNELYYVDPEEIGLSGDNLLDGTKIKLYFDENGQVIAGYNFAKMNQEIESRVITMLIVVVIIIVLLVSYHVVARKTFGKYWYQWLHFIKQNRQQLVYNGQIDKRSYR